MKLNLDIINDYLPEDYERRKLGTSDRLLHLGRPLFYDAGCGMEKDTLYIAGADSLPETPPPHPLSIICIGKPLRTEWLSGHCEILQITNQNSLIRVFNDIQKIYDYFEAWDMGLRDALEQKEPFDIKEILIAGSSVFGNMVQVCDHRLSVIFRCRFQASPDGGPSCVIQDTPEPMTMDYGEKIKQICQAERKITVPYLSSVLDDSMMFYCSNLYVFDRFTGCVNIGSDCRPFRDSDFPLFDHYFLCFEKAFHRYLQNLSQSGMDPSTAIRKLYEHQPLSTGEKQFFTLSGDEAWACFALKPKPDKQAFPKDYMYAMLNNFLADCVCAMLYRNNIVGLIKVTKDIHYDSDPTLQTLRDILERMDYFGGVSNSFTDLDAFHEYDMQACYVAEQYQGRKDMPSLDFFENHALRYMLDHCCSDCSLQSLYTRSLWSVIRYDQKKKTGYLHTLDVYLKNEMNITKTAADLYLHRSSMIKRIEKLHQLLGSDLGNPDERLYYRICLAMINARHQCLSSTNIP